MKAKPDLASLSNAVLVDEFAGLAKLRGMAVLDGEVGVANRIYDQMRDIDLELRARGRGARLELVPLLSGNDRLVRYYAARCLMGLVPEQVRPVIEENARWWRDPISLDAGMALNLLDAGISKPD